MKNGKKILSTALFAVLAGLMVWYVYHNRAEMAGLLKLDAPTVALMLALALVSCVINAYYHKIILDTYAIPLRLTDWMGVVSIANAMAYVLPMRADLVFSAAYYKRTKGLAYVKSVSIAAGNIVFGVAFSLLGMLAALVLTGLIDGLWPATLWLCWSAAAALVAGFIAFALVVESKRPQLLDKARLVGDVVRGFNALLRNGALLRRVLLCLILKQAVQLGLYLACFRAIGMHVTVYQALFFNSVSWIATIVAIVPGNIGIKEAVMGVAMTLMSGVFSHGVTVSLLQRAALLIVDVALACAFAYPVWRSWNAAAPTQPK